MLSFDPNHDANKLYLFEDADRQRAKQQLMEDIPRKGPRLLIQVAISGLFLA
jgi:hypothetical protein